MKIIFLGDVHAEWMQLEHTLRKVVRNDERPDLIVQVGDFGWNFQEGQKNWEPDQELQENLPWPILAIDGNHENFDLLKKYNGWNSQWFKYLGRGEIYKLGEFTILGMGGATSIDKHYRIHGRDWWPEEQITYQNVNNALKIDDKIDLIVSHDRPDCFPSPISQDKLEYGKGDRMALQALYEHFKPTYWAYGHYHGQFLGTFEQTQFACCPIIDTHRYVVLNEDIIYVS